MLVDLQQLEGVVENGTFLKLNEKLVPVLEAQSTSSTTPAFKDWSTWRLAAHGLWWFLTFYKRAEVDKLTMRDGIYGRTSTHNILRTEVVRATKTLFVTGVSKLFSYCLSP